MAKNTGQNHLGLWPADGNQVVLERYKWTWCQMQWNVLYVQRSQKHNRQAVVTLTFDNLQPNLVNLDLTYL